MHFLLVYCPTKRSFDATFAACVSLLFHIFLFAVMLPAAASAQPYEPIVIDPSHPTASWLANGAVFHVPAVASGSLLALPPHNIGWFEFTFINPHAGWRKLAIAGAPNSGLGRAELAIDLPAGNRADGMPWSGTLLPNQWVWLTPGPHTMRIIANNWTAMPQVASIKLETRKSGLGAFRLLSERIDLVAALGRCRPLQILLGGNNSSARVDIIFRLGNLVLRTETIEIGPSPQPVLKRVPAACDRAGDVTATISFAGAEPDENLQTKAHYSVFDTRPIESEFRNGKLVTEIDTTTEQPDFSSGETDVTQTPTGSYRESSETGFTNFQRGGGKGPAPGWFAYRVNGLQTGRSYLMDIEYPDDKTRTFVAAFRGALTDGYPTSLGFETGGIWPVSGGMAHRSAIIWPTSADGRLIIFNVHDHQRAAVSHIRIYEIENVNRPTNRVTRNESRDVVVWSEEGYNFRYIVGGSKDQKDVFAIIERYLQLANSIGATIVSPTVAIYNFALYPSRYNLAFADNDSDLTKAFIIGAQKYGLKVIPEIHPRADELLWPPRTTQEFQHRLLMSSSGELRPPYYNPLVSEVGDWYGNVVGELAERYKDYRSFSGVQIRVSDWQNQALNNLVSLDWGYDAETVARFLHEKSLAVPAGISLDNNAPDLVKKRHDVLLAQFRETWVHWRCEKVRDIFRSLVQRIRKARSDLTIQVSFFALDAGDGTRQPGFEKLLEKGIDLNMLKSVDGLVLIDARFQHGSKEESPKWRQSVRDEFRGPEGVRIFGDNGQGALTIFPMQYIELSEQRAATSAQLGLNRQADDPWVSAASEPPGRLQLARYAELVGLFDVYMLGDGGNGYVFSGEGLRDFMLEFRTLPKKPFERSPNAPDTLALRSNDKLFYLTSLSAETQSVRIEVACACKLRRLATSENVPVHKGSILLTIKPYELLVFVADKRIGKLKATVQ